MNARTTTLLIVLALALAACVAPIQAPPVKLPSQPSTEQQVLPLPKEPAQNVPSVQQPQAIPQPAPETISDIGLGVWSSMMASTYALPEQNATIPKQPAVQELDDMLKPEVELPASTMPMRDQWYLEEQSYVLPEQATTNPKQPAVQELDDMLKPVTLPARMLPEQAATNPKQPAVQELDDMLKPVTLPARVLPEQAATNPKQPDVQALDNMLKPEDELPASTMPVRDQWYLETP